MSNFQQDKDPVSMIEYGLYSLVTTGWCTEDDILLAQEWLESAKECIEYVKVLGSGCAWRSDE